MTSPFDTSTSFAAKPEVSLLTAAQNDSSVQQRTRGQIQPFLDQLKDHLDSTAGTNDQVVSSTSDSFGDVSKKKTDGDFKHCFDVFGLKPLFVMLNSVLERKAQFEDIYVSQYRSKAEYFTSVHSLMSSVEKALNEIKGVCGSESDRYLHSSKVLTLRKLLQAFVENDRNQPFCGIIFVERRYSALLLSQIVANWATRTESLMKLKPVFAVGQVHGSLGARISEREINDALNKFRKGEANLLIATNVIEEGIDIPHCNFVCKFDLPQNFRSYIQSKGRARAEGSHYFILATEEEYKIFNPKLNLEFANIETFINSECCKRVLPTDTECFAQNEESQIEPYEPFDYPGSPKVTAGSALALVNRYCQLLPTDQFAVLKPIFSLKQTAEQSYKASLRLPSSSVIKEIIVGETQLSSKGAKVSAALIACRLLHEAGELDDSLRPVRAKTKKNSGSRTGNSSSKASEHQNVVIVDYKCYAPCLSKSLSNLKEFCWYEIKHDTIDTKWICEFIPNFVKSPSLAMGFMTSEKLPTLPDFLIYTMFGSEVVTVKYKHRVTLSQGQFEKLVETSQWLFEDVLQIPDVKLDLGQSPFQILTVICDRGNKNFLEKRRLEKQAEIAEWNNSVYKFPSRGDIEKNKERLHLVEKFCGKDEGVVVRLIGDKIAYATKDRTRFSDFRPKYKMCEAVKQCFTAEVLYHAMCMPTILHRVSSIVFCESFMAEVMEKLCVIDNVVGMCTEQRGQLIRAKQFTVIPSVYDNPSEEFAKLVEETNELSRADQQPMGPGPLNLLKCVTLRV